MYFLFQGVFDDTKDGYITFGKFIRFAMGENDDRTLVADGDDALGKRIRQLLEKIYEWTEDFDPNTEKKYWYNPASASSVYECPESLMAAVKALEAEKALIDSQRREQVAVKKQKKAEDKAKKSMAELPKTMNEFVNSLAGNNEFVDMLAKQLGLQRSDESKEEERRKKIHQKESKDKPKNDMLAREQLRLEGLGVNDLADDGKKQHNGSDSDSSDEDDDDDGAIAAEKRRQALLKPRDDSMEKAAELERRKLGRLTVDTGVCHLLVVVNVICLNVFIHTFYFFVSFFQHGVV
jgi:hypothetical protein